MTDLAPCTVQRRCSNTGQVCSVEDRACQGDAIAHGLEISCELKSPPSFVYCPPGAQQRDSPVVWILLGIAVLIAAFGSLVGWMVFRRPKAAPAKAAAAPAKKKGG